MDTNMKIKEEDPLSDDVASQNERQFFTEDVAIRTEVKSETTLADFCSQKETECFNIHLDLDSQKEKEFLPGGLQMKDKYNSDQKMDYKLEMKNEPCWRDTETSSVCDEFKDGDFPPVKSSRLYTEADSGDSPYILPLPLAEVSKRESSSYNGTEYYECERQKSDITKTPTVKQYVQAEQSGQHSDEEVCSRTLNSKQNKLIYKGKKLNKCKICDKSFTRMSGLKLHHLIHEGKKPHQCNSCGKSFTELSNLKRHYLIHEGKKPHQCKSCGKSFTGLSDMKRHNLTHEGKKPHKCPTCDKKFTRMSDLKKHNLIHEGKKPHQCKTCDKTFSQLSNLKKHNLIHERQEVHQCRICDKSFTWLSHLKIHNFIHVNKKPQCCEICGKSFIHLSDLKRHNLSHQNKKPH